MATTNDITIYSTSWCGFCKMVTKYLDNKSITYVEKNIETDESAREEMMKKLDGNFQGVPVVDVNNQIIVGFDRPKIDAALKS